MTVEGEDIVRICYYMTTGKDAADWENLVCTVAICKAYKLVRLLELLVVTSYKHPINSVTNPNPMSAHYHVTVFSLFASYGFCQ
jgi:hypothetical protein